MLFRRCALAVLALGLVVVPIAQSATAQTPEAGPEVFIAAARSADYGQRLPVVDRLAAHSVLRMTVIGFEPESRGVMEQCSVGGCGNPFPIAFDIDGRAEIQYLVVDDFAAGFDPPSRCRALDPSCVVRISTDDHFASFSTVFLEPEVPREITVTPNREELVTGTDARITVTGFAPGERVQAMFCVAPHTFGTEGCGAPGPVSQFTIDADGIGRTTLAVREGHVGSSGGSCGGSSRCSIVVTHPKSSVAEAFVAVGFADGPSAQYDAMRLAAGLGVAGLLIALAVYLVRSTDWRKPSEANTPDLDAATFFEDND